MSVEDTVQTREPALVIPSSHQRALSGNRSARQWLRAAVAGLALVMRPGLLLGKLVR